jgi:hypothetical protein
VSHFHVVQASGGHGPVRSARVVIQVEDAPIQRCALLPPIWQRRCFGAAEPGRTTRMEQRQFALDRAHHILPTKVVVRVHAHLSLAPCSVGRRQRGVASQERQNAGERGDRLSRQCAAQRDNAQRGLDWREPSLRAPQHEKPGLPFSPCHSPTYNTHAQGLLESVDLSAIERPFRPHQHNWQHNWLASRSRFRSQPRARSYSRCRAAPMRGLERWLYPCLYGCRSWHACPPPSP